MIEAIAFPDGALFAVESVDVLSRHASHYVQSASDQEGQPVSLHVQREEFQLRLWMPGADVPLDVAGTLTVGEMVLSTTVSEIQPSGKGMVAKAVGVQESFILPED